MEKFKINNQILFTTDVLWSSVVAFFSLHLQRCALYIRCIGMTTNIVQWRSYFCSELQSDLINLLFAYAAFNFRRSFLFSANKFSSTSIKWTIFSTKNEIILFATILSASKSTKGLQHGLYSIYIVCIGIQKTKTRDIGIIELIF